MGPERFRKSLGFAALGAAPLTLLTASPALAQGLSIAYWMSAAPIAIAIGAGGFGVMALLLLKARLRDTRRIRQEAADQVASLRVLLDQYEAILSGAREITIIWASGGGPARILGQCPPLLPPGRPREALLSFSSWLNDGDADRLARAVEALRVDGRGFEISMPGRDGLLMRMSGTTIGDGTALRIRPATEQGEPPSAAGDAMRSLLAALPDPAVLRDSSQRVAFANPAWHLLARRLGRKSSETQPAELLDTARPPSGTPAPRDVVLGDAGAFDLVNAPLGGGYSATVLRAALVPAPPVVVAAPQLPARSNGHLGAVIDALAVPIAIFNSQRELVQVNRAYADLWDLDPNWFRPGMDEREILDRLRTESKLPAEADYHAWRAQHFAAAYSLTAPRETDPWHLPDGRTINVIEAPASAEGGVIYVFEDMTAQLRLKSLNRALLDVQRSTLNSLTEAVAVFGTNGRLTLSNPRLSALWKLPMNELGQSPHIDQIAEACAATMPEDGASIWRDLKRAIIDLNPARTDTSGRLNRADGRLLDYAIVRLPDGQSMMTFLDVTESANYSRVLKERNEALVTADRLKDAFVQNVSYELRSPLTNIIGFADLLASGEVGALNERQHAYTNYIRASSETLGLLIDNILDLATVDAGVAELQPEPLDVASLIDKARAGLAATFPEIDGERTLNLVVDLPANLPPLVADGTRIVQILYNLLSSAARFSEPGAEIRLTAAVRGARMVFIVEDEGTEMTDDLRSTIEQTGPELSGRQRGAGLGLSIVRAFVSLHGGTIAFEAREPRGNRVIVSLPRDVAAVGAAE